MKINGTISNTSAKDWRGRNGTVVLYSFQLEGDGAWYRCGTSKPPYGQGDTVSFEYTEANGARTVTDGTMVKAESTGAKRAPAPKAGKVQENWDARAAYWDAKEKRDIEVVEPRITLTAARSAAIEVIGLALAHDAIAFGNANKGARLGIILDSIDEVTARYFKQAFNATAEGAKPVEEAAPEAEGYDDEIPE